MLYLVYLPNRKKGSLIERNPCKSKSATETFSQETLSLEPWHLIKPAFLQQIPISQYWPWERRALSGKLNMCSDRISLIVSSRNIGTPFCLSIIIDAGSLWDPLHKEVKRLDFKSLNLIARGWRLLSRYTLLRYRNMTNWYIERRWSKIMAHKTKQELCSWRKENKLKKVTWWADCKLSLNVE
jgi:hypothetical protein